MFSHIFSIQFHQLRNLQPFFKHSVYFPLTDLQNYKLEYSEYSNCAVSFLDCYSGVFQHTLKSLNQVYMYPLYDNNRGKSISFLQKLANV